MKKNRKPDDAAFIESTYMMVKAIDKLVGLGLVEVDMLNALVSVDSCVHIYYRQLLPGSKDEDKFYKCFCTMLRAYINYQRAVKKGDLLRMLEAGEYDAITRQELDLAGLDKPVDKPGKQPSEGESPCPTLPQGELTDGQKRDWLNSYIESRYAPLPDSTSIVVVTIGHDSRPLVSATECKVTGSIRFKPIGERK